MKKITTALMLAALVGGTARAQQPDGEGWTLQQCIRHAQENSLSIKQREIAAEQQRVQLSTARNSRLPNLSASASQNFGFGRALTSNNTYSNNNTQSSSFGLSTGVPLFTGLQITHNIKYSRLNLEASLEDLEKAREDISVNVASQYVQVLYAQELCGVAEEQVRLAERQHQVVQAFYDNGKRTQLQLLEAQSTLAGNRLSLTQARNELDLALLTLSQLLELPTPQGFAIVAMQGEVGDEEIALPQELYAVAVTEKPQIRAAELRMQGAHHSIRVAQSQLYPSLYLSAGLGSSYYQTSGYQTAPFSEQMKNNFNQYVGLSLSVPIFNRLATRNSVRQARLQYDSYRWQLEESRKGLYKEIQQAYYSAVAAKEKLKSSRAALQAGEASFGLMSEKYANGLATATEYNENRAAYLKSLSDMLQAKYDYLFRLKILDFYRGVPLDL